MNLIPSLGVNIKHCSENVLEGSTWLVSEKVDGMRCLFVKDEWGTVTAYSRSGIKIDTLDHITSFLAAPWFPEGLIFDTELVDQMSYIQSSSSYKTRRNTIGIFNSKQEDKHQLIALCFDIYIPGELTPYNERLARMQQLLISDPVKEPISLIPQLGRIEGNDTFKISKLFNDVCLKDGEGLMLHKADSPHIPGRSLSLLKVKRFKEFSGTVMDYRIADEDTKLKDGIASLICDIKGCTVPVKVGTGFDYETRKSLLRNVEYLKGCKIEIEGLGYTSSKKGYISIINPIFKCLHYYTNKEED